MKVTARQASLWLWLALQAMALAENPSSAPAKTNLPPAETPPPPTMLGTAATASAPAPPNALVGALLSANPEYKYEPRTLSVDEKKGLIKIRGCRSLNNLAPLATVDFCTDLTIHGCEVASLEPIRKFKLTRLDVGDCPVSDLGPLQGMPISELIVVNTKVKSLEPLRGMPLRALNTNVVSPSFYEVIGELKTLENLELHYCQLDAEGLKKLQPTLKFLLLNHILFTGKAPVDLNSFREQPLTTLRLIDTEPVHWSALANFHHLESLSLTNVGFDNIQPLRGLPLATLIINQAKPRPLNIAGIQSFPLKQLIMKNCLVDLTPLAGSPVNEIAFTRTCISGGFEALHACPGLTSITVFSTSPAGKEEKKSYSGAKAVEDFFRDSAAGTEKP